MIVLSGLEAKRYSITSDGISELRHQLDSLKRQRMAVAAAMRDIASQTTDTGAMEDSALALNQNQAIELDGQLVLLERIIGMADVIEKPKRRDQVRVGSCVTVIIDDKERRYTIVGPVEADPMAGKISTESPLGRSILHRKVGERFEIISPTGKRSPAVITAIG